MTIGFVGEVDIEGEDGARACRNCFGLGVHPVTARNKREEKPAGKHTGNEIPGRRTSHPEYHPVSPLRM